jgi:hypothetical protein
MSKRMTARRTFIVATADYRQERVSNSRMSLDHVIADQVQDWNGELAYVLGLGHTVDCFVSEVDHRTIWEENGLRAALRPGRLGRGHALRSR